MEVTDAIKVKLLDIDKYVEEAALQPVTSHMIYEPSTSIFDSQGLYSEEIFGQIGTVDRYERVSYINLNTKVIQPFLFKAIVSLKVIYKDIIAGKRYAIFDKEKKDFVAAPKDDENANTGYGFFCRHIGEIEFEKKESIRTRDKIANLEKYRDILFMDKILVIAAGMRDVDTSSDRVQADEINKYYMTLLKYARGLPQNSETNSLYDNVRYRVQLKVNQIYDYLYNIVEGKGGFIQRQYASRDIVSSSRNTIGPSNSKVSHPDDPQYIKCTEIGVPLFEAVATNKILMTHTIRSFFISSIFDGKSSTVPLINPKSLELEYVEVDESEKEVYTSGDGISTLINRFKHTDFRTKPVAVKAMDNKWWYLYLIYDTGDDIYILRSIEEFKAQYKGTVDMKKMRPMTYLEFFYICGYVATRGKHTSATRYPVIHAYQINSARTHLLSTDPPRKVNFYPSATSPQSIPLPRYPIIGNPYFDNAVLHKSFLASYGADFDGDQMNVVPLFGDDTNDETREFMFSVRAVVHPTGKLILDICTDNNELTFYNLSKINDKYA